MRSLSGPADRRKKPSQVRKITTSLALAFVLLIAACLGSLAFGSVAIPFDTLADMLFDDASSTTEAVLVETLRAPRTMLGLLVGAGLGGAGALMQTLTRSPLADPGLLGVNAGAAALVITGIYFFGVTSLEAEMILAFAGAGAAMLVVYGVGTAVAGPSGSPLPLLLAGIAVTAALGGISTVMLLNDPTTFDAIRQWSAGSLSTNGFAAPIAAALPTATGLALALIAARDLNALSLGDESASGLGVDVTRLRVIIFMAVALLCGTATAAVGPIGFVGLMAPHLARMIVGPDERLVLILSMLIAPSVLLISDIAGRLLLWPAEIQVGIVTAFIGAPVLIVLACRRLA